MNERSDHEFIHDHRLDVERALGAVCKRMGLNDDEREDFESEVWLHLVAHGERVREQFEGRSSVRTYLHTVVANLAHDHRIRKWGKWRPTLAAQRLGTVAIRLEVLIHRDGFSQAEALRRVRAENPRLTDADVEGVIAQLPKRTPRRREVSLVTEPGGAERADQEMERAGRSRDLMRIKQHVALAVKDMSATERRLMRERFLQGRTVTEIAREREEDRRALYRTFERCLRKIRKHLDSAGIDREQLLAVVQSTDLTITFSALETS